MSDSGSFSSLLALVDSHFSKTQIQASQSEAGNSSGSRISIPPLTGVQNGTLSETRLMFGPGQRLPRLGTTESPISNVLAEQVANMLKSKERKKKEEEEKQRLDEEMKKLKLEENADEFVIDLMQALHKPGCSGPQTKLKSSVSNSSSMESLFEPNYVSGDERHLIITPEPLLPLNTDMSYILDQQIPRAKCSAFGKVLTARLRRVAAPYLMEHVKSDIVRFDFKTKSPCDLIKEKLRKPTTFNSYGFDILSSIMTNN